jgi:hypothetical protein
VDKTFSFIGKVVPKVIGEVVNFVKAHWLLLVTIIGGPLALIVARSSSTSTRSSGSPPSRWVPWSTPRRGTRGSPSCGHRQGRRRRLVLQEAAREDHGVRRGASGQLQSLGVAIVSGLAHGISAAAHWVYDAVQRIIDNIPKKIRQIMGIASPSKVTTELGKNIGEGLAVGMERSSGKAEDAAKKVADKIKARLATLMDSFKSLKSGVAGNFAGNMFSASAQAAVLDENGNVVTPAQTVGQNLLSNLHSTSGSLSQLIPAFKTLKKWGWKPGILAALFQSGGPDLIIELANNQGEANEALGLFGGITKMSNRLGGLVATDVYGNQIDAAQNQLHGKGGKKGKGGKRRPVGAHVATPTT